MAAGFPAESTLDDVIVASGALNSQLGELLGVEGEAHRQMTIAVEELATRQQEILDKLSHVIEDTKLATRAAVSHPEAVREELERRIAALEKGGADAGDRGGPKRGIGDIRDIGGWKGPEAQAFPEWAWSFQIGLDGVRTGLGTAAEWAA